VTTLQPKAYDSVLGWFCCNAWFNRIHYMHSKERTRFYHTINHVQELFESLDTLINEGGKVWTDVDWAVTAMATFFHDSIYDPKSGTNEEDSALLWLEFCDGVGLKGVVKDTVRRYILETKTHDVGGCGDEILKFFIDSDMAVLGKKEEAYDHYAGLIRSEYVHIDRDVYCEKRAEVLEGFLKVESIFASDVVRGRLEGRARGNIRREIESLRRKVIPREREKRGEGEKEVGGREKEENTKKTFTLRLHWVLGVVGVGAVITIFHRRRKQI